MLIDLKNFIPKNYKIETKSVPLRIWTNEWPLPKNIRFIPYKNKVRTSHKTNIVLINYGLFGAVETNKEYRKRIYKNKNPKKWGKGKKSGRRFDYMLIGDKIFIKILSKCANLNLENRKLSFDGNYLRINLKKNECGVWYTSNEGQIRHCIIPKTLNLESDFFEMLGILDGEMNKKLRKGRNNQSIKISNAEPKIIKFLINKFKKYLLINEKSWRASITINSKKINSPEKIDKNLKKFWSELTKIPLTNFSKTTLCWKYISKNSPKGIIQIRYNNAILFKILINLLTNIKKDIILNKIYIQSYLRGLAAAEGGVGKVYNRKTEALRIIFISSTNHEEKLFYILCLENLGIDSYKEYPLRVEIYGKSNFKKLYSLNLFKYNPKRKKHFVKLFRKLSFNDR